MKLYDGREDLVRTLRSPDEDVVVVVGSGFTIQSTDPLDTAASWPGLIAHGASYAESQGLMTADERADVEAALSSTDASVLISAATTVQTALQSRDPGDFDRWLAVGPGTFELADPRLLEAIWSLGRRIATTNYDTLLSAGRTTPVAWNDHGMALQVVRGAVEGVLHLHGVHTVPDSVVFGDAGYDAVLADEHAQVLAKVLALRSTLLFIGCGPGLSDPNLGNLFAWLRAHAVRHHHYRLVPDQDWSKLDRIPGLVDIRCGPWEDLPAFVEGLAPAAAGASAGRSSPVDSRPVNAMRLALAATRDLRRVLRDARVLIRSGSEDTLALGDSLEDLRRFHHSDGSPLARFRAATNGASDRVRTARQQFDEHLTDFETRLDDYAGNIAEGYAGSPTACDALRRLRSELPKLEAAAENLLESFAEPA